MNFEDRLRQAFDDVAERLRDDVQRELHAAIPALTRQLGDPTPTPPSAPEPAPARDEESIERLLAAVREIDDATSLAEVLEATLWAAAREATRACVFLVRADRLALWRRMGFGDDAQQRAEPLEVALARGGIVADAVTSRDVVLADAVDRLPIGLPAPPSFGGGVARALQVDGQAVAILYADRDADNTSEAASRKLAFVVELLSRHASRCLEVITAFRTAQLFTQPAAVNEAQRLVRWEASADAHDWVEDDAESARRYARLLISEIKLYHEPAVIAGRRDRNLASRLGGEIARARSLYEQRVPRELDRRTDYFDAEVVRTLANGDVSLLGVAN